VSAGALGCAENPVQVADYCVLQHEGVNAPADWARCGAACLAHLKICASEVEHWIDELHPAFEAVSLH